MWKLYMRRGGWSVGRVKGAFKEIDFGLVYNTRKENGSDNKPNLVVVEEMRGCEALTIKWTL